MLRSYGYACGVCTPAIYFGAQVVTLICAFGHDEVSVVNRGFYRMLVFKQSCTRRAVVRIVLQMFLGIGDETIQPAFNYDTIARPTPQRRTDLRTYAGPD